MITVEFSIITSITFIMCLYRLSVLSVSNSSIQIYAKDHTTAGIHGQNFHPRDFWKLYTGGLGGREINPQSIHTPQISRIS